MTVQEREEKLKGKEQKKKERYELFIDPETGKPIKGAETLDEIEYEEFEKHFETITEEKPEL